jgi:hypothetical protein
MAPVSLESVYLPGITNALMLLDVDNHIKASVSSPQAQAVLKGFKRFYFKRSPAAKRLKLAFGMDLATLSQQVMRDLDAFSTYRNAEGQICVDKPGQALLQLRIFTIEAVGINFMLRKSEHIVTKGMTTSKLLRHLLVFYDHNGKRIPYAHIGRVKAEKVLLNVEFAKTDHSGFGRRPFHTRQDARAEVCVVCILEHWLSTTRDKYGATETMPLYDVPGFRSVRIDELHSIMEMTVKSLGIGSYGINATSHSLRYGGATMMAAAGFPQYLIAHYGGWSQDSTALLRYCRPSEESIQQVSRYMTEVALRNPSRLHIQDLIARQQSKR